MTHRERFRTALAHREPDWVPFDVGGSIVTSISAKTYEKVIAAMGLPARQIHIANEFAQTAALDEDFLTALDTDTRPTHLGNPTGFEMRLWEENGYRYYTDDWQITYCFPLDGSAEWYQVAKHPLADATSVKDIDIFNWPEGADPGRIEGLAEEARHLAEDRQFGIVLEYNIGGIFEWPGWLRGTENFLMDLAAEPKMAQSIMEKITEFKCAFWESALKCAGKWIDVVRESDDFGSQGGLLVSTDRYRKYMKPLHKRITDTIKKYSDAAICLHSCGAVRDLIPDFIEAGFTVLNPVQVGAAKMNPIELKKEFGKDLVFWGGAADAQTVLPRATPAEVKEHARRNLDALMPGGGYIFGSINVVGGDVPPENFLALAEVVREYGAY